MSREIPVGALVELRGSKDDWRLVSYWDNEVPAFCRQYMVQNTMTGLTKRVFKHEMFEKDTSTYKDINEFFNDQLSQEIQEDFLNESMTETDGDLDFNVALAELLQPQESPQLTTVTENQPESPPPTTVNPSESPQLTTVNPPETGFPRAHGNPADSPQLTTENPPDSPKLTTENTPESPQHNAEQEQPPKKRFKTVTDEDIECIASKTTEATRNQMTKWAIKLFKEWIQETDASASEVIDNLGSITPEQLDLKLSKFYASLQTRKGKEYSKSALTGLRAGINRFFRQPPHNRLFNIMKDREFQKSNTVLIGILKDLKRCGKDISENKEPISPSDLQKLRSSGLLSTETPQTLQNKVLFDIMTHFGRRGREGLRALKPDSFKFATDSEGHRYVAMAYNEADKTHHGVDSREKPKAPRMYSTGDDSCPVAAFEKYLSKLNPENNALFQKPLLKYHKDGAIWYSKIPVGVNHLYEFMPRLSAEAGLSKRYTNHCIRAMVVSTLFNAGVSNVGIMSVSGHRSAESLLPYLKPSDSERRNTSGLLSGVRQSNLSLTQVPRTQIVPQSRFFPGSFSTHAHSPAWTDTENHSQFNSQSNSKINSFSIFSGNVTGGNITVNVYKQ